MALLLLSPKIDKLVLGNEAAKIIWDTISSKIGTRFLLQAGSCWEDETVAHPQCSPTPSWNYQKTRAHEAFYRENSKWKLQFLKNLFCHITLAKNRNNIPKGCCTIMALNKTTQWLNQDHLVCTEKKLPLYKCIFRSPERTLEPASAFMYTPKLPCAKQGLAFPKREHSLVSFHEIKWSTPQWNQSITLTNKYYSIWFLKRKNFSTTSVLSLLLFL